MSTQHTQGEWRIGDAGLTIFGPKTEQPTATPVACAVHSMRTTPAERRANIRRIVHCVNNHDQLIDAVELLLGIVNTMPDLSTKEGWVANTATALLRQAKGPQ